MGRLANKDWDAEVKGVERTDEIGDMARAVQTFTEQGQEAEQLQTQIESERKTREAERLEQEALLKDAVGGIVAAAKDRKTDVEGKRVAVRVKLGGGRIS